MSAKHHTYDGVIQVYSDRSGGMSLEQSLVAARETGIDFIIFTERNGDEDARKMEGWHDDVFVLVGEEVRYPDGEYFAFNCPEWVQPQTGLTQSLGKVNEHSATVCTTVNALAEKKELTDNQCWPMQMDLDRADMISIWSFLDEFVSRVTGDRALLFQQRPERVLYGPTRKALRQWDDQLIERDLPAIGCVNAVHRKDPLLQWKEFFAFRTGFKTIRTLILLDEKLSEDSSKATQQVWDAICGGRSVIYNYSIDSIDKFSFCWVDSDQNSYSVGDRTPWKTGGKIMVSTPKPCEIVIRCNGAPLFWGTGENIDFPAATPGVYRVEAWLDRRLWILSNCIRLTDPRDMDVEPETLLDFT